MLKVERHNIIEKMLSKQGFVLVPTLSEIFRCSEETVRRDLREMESGGVLVRTHGGAYLIEKFDKSYPTNLRKSFFHDIKDKLARHAMQHIEENDVVMLDSSTTCLTLAEALAQSQKTVTIITNSLPICSLFNESNRNINLICLGGEYRRRTSSFTDQNTVDLLKTYHADRTFISCPKLTTEFGLSDNHLSEARVREAMLRQAQHRYLLVDHTKFDSSANILFDGLETVDTLITNQKVSPEWEEYAKKHHMKLEYC